MKRKIWKNSEGSRFNSGAIAPKYRTESQLGHLVLGRICIKMLARPGKTIVFNSGWAPEKCDPKSDLSGMNIHPFHLYLFITAKR
jgi:hypothetical protein